MLEARCTLKSFVAKQTARIDRTTVKDLRSVLGSCVDTNFKNSVVTTVMDKKCKVFTNFTIHTTGVVDLGLIVSVMNELVEKLALLTDPEELKYEVFCVMSNWSMHVGVSNVDLQELLHRLNEDGVCISLFLNGKSLINKISTTYPITTNTVGYSSETGRFEIESSRDVFKTVDSTLLLYKSGKCVFSGPHTIEDVDASLRDVFSYIRTKAC